MIESDTRCPYCGGVLGRRFDPLTVAIVAVTLGTLLGNAAGASLDESLGAQ